jgi:hypothetical protein
MPTFIVKIETDNAAFEDGPGFETARILGNLARIVRNGAIDGATDDYSATGEAGLIARGFLRDVNGNKVGSWEYATSIDATTPPAPKTVRVRENFRACRVLGTFVRETDKAFVYRREDGKTLTAKKLARARYAQCTPPKPHVEPCVDCADHPESRRTPDHCIHGRRYGVEVCESCLSM